MNPRLLVSVRNRTEARYALRGGAEIVDVKEPANGPLGMSTVDDIREVQQELAEWNLARSPEDSVRLSIALGECSEWNQRQFQLETEGHPRDRDWLNSAFLKLGPAHLLQPDGRTAVSHLAANNTPAASTTVEQGAPKLHWVSQMNQARRAITEPLVQQQLPSINHRNLSEHQTASTQASANVEAAWRPWIAVAYADAHLCDAPDVPDITHAAAADPGCAGVLIDTYCKDGRGLLHWMTIRQLVQIRETTQKAGILLAVAGQLKPVHFSQLIAVRPDVIGVRGSVCNSGNRTLGVRESLVSEMRQQIRSAFST